MNPSITNTGCAADAKLGKPDASGTRSYLQAKRWSIPESVSYPWNSAASAPLMITCACQELRLGTLPDSQMPAASWSLWPQIRSGVERGRNDLHGGERGHKLECHKLEQLSQSSSAILNGFSVVIDLRSHPSTREKLSRPWWLRSIQSSNFQPNISSDGKSACRVKCRRK